MKRVLSYIVWVMLIGSLVLAFVMTGSSLLLGLAIAVIVLPLLTFILTLVALPQIELQIAGPSSASKGEPIPCTLTCKNNSLIPLLRLEVCLSVHNKLTSHTYSEPLRLSCKPKGSLEMPILLSSTVCGRLDLRITGLKGFDPFGLFSKTRRLDERKMLAIMPRLHTVVLNESFALAPLSDVTLYSPVVKGTDASEVFSLREYVPGDDLRSMHWKLSAKTDGLIVREASFPLDNSLLVFWDKGLYGQEATSYRADAMAEVALNVCESLASAGIPYDLASYEVGEERCWREYVSDKNEIYEVIGLLMSTPLGEAAESGIDAYVRMYKGLGFSRLVYIGAGMPAHMQELCRGKKTVAFICDDGESVDTMDDFTQIRFRQDGAALALSMAGWSK